MHDDNDYDDDGGGNADGYDFGVDFGDDNDDDDDDYETPGIHRYFRYKMYDDADHDDGQDDDDNDAHNANDNKGIGDADTTSGSTADIRILLNFGNFNFFLEIWEIFGNFWSAFVCLGCFKSP